MSALQVQGGQPLNGSVTIPGAKNAILPLMASSVLTNKPVIFKNVPNISDVHSMKKLLVSHGVLVEDIAADQVRITATSPRPEPEDPTISGEFRASVLLLGPLLARLGRAKVYLPGGDNIDSKGRPIDMHVTNLRRLGATVRERPTYVEAFAPANGLTAPSSNGRWQPLHLPKVSVGATQNTIMAACAATGTTIIENASIEPETLDLIKFMQNLGAEIQVDKAKHKITITGKEITSYGIDGRMYQHSLRSHTKTHTVIPDRIVAGTFAIAAVITGGRIDLQMGNFSNQIILELLESEFWRLLAAGVEITRLSTGVVRVERKRDFYGQLFPIEPVSVKTRPYPGFPTDLHPQWAALMCFSNGQSWIEETIFDNRFNYVEELCKMGAVIYHDVRRVNIIGNPSLQQDYQSGVIVEASDIRAGAALILAALARNGTTQITGLHHVERGYEDFVNKFTSCGANMQVF